MIEHVQLVAEKRDAVRRRAAWDETEGKHWTTGELQGMLRVAEYEGPGASKKGCYVLSKNVRHFGVLGRLAEVRLLDSAAEGRGAALT